MPKETHLLVEAYSRVHESLSKQDSNYLHQFDQVNGKIVGPLAYEHAKDLVKRGYLQHSGPRFWLTKKGKEARRVGMYEASTWVPGFGKTSKKSWGKAKAASEKQTGKKTCLKCDGKGYRYGKACSKCDGLGLVVKEAHERAIEKATDNPGDRCWKLCRCANCGIERQCTPEFDFYGDVGEDLKCERCFHTEFSDVYGIDKVIDQHGNTLHSEADFGFKHHYEAMMEVANEKGDRLVEDIKSLVNATLQGAGHDPDKYDPLARKLQMDITHAIIQKLNIIYPGREI